MGKKKITNYLFGDHVDVFTRVTRTLQILECEAVVRGLSTIIKRAEEEQLTYVDFLDLLFDQEMHEREDNRITRWQKQARFPWTKTIDDYDFSYPEFIKKKEVLTLAECEWVKNGSNIIFFGPSGVGKTHLSIALGIEAIRRGYETRFVVVDHLTEMINIAIGKDKAHGGGEYRKKLLSSFSNVKLLILDELAYSQISQEVSDFLFSLICRRYEQKTSTVFTSNEGLDTWGRFFSDNQVRAMAALDRIMHSCIPITIRGQSFRSVGLKKK